MFQSRFRAGMKLLTSLAVVFADWLLQILLHTVDSIID